MEPPEGSLVGCIRWILAFSVLLLVCTAAPVLADSPPELTASEAQSPAVEDSGASLPSAEDIAKGIAEAERKEAERGEELESTEAVRERKASRDAYANLGATEAEQLLNAKFSEQLATLNADPARFLTEAKLDQSFGEFGAKITNGEGETQLLESSVPVRAEDEEGQLLKLDLTLEQTGEGFAPANPLVDLKLGESAAEGVEVGEAGLAITQAGAEEGDTGRLFGDKNVFYPEAGVDTDLLASPTSSGVELFDQLRSERSPQTLRFYLDLPAGATLRSDGAGGAEVVGSDNGPALASIPPPSAQDAQGSQVPVALEVDGNAIVLTVNHREGDFAYPILVDPEVKTDSFGWYWGYDLGALENENTWYWSSNDNSQLAHSTSCIYTCWSGSHRGLYISATNANYAANAYGQWAYTAPGETTYIPSIYPTVSASLSPFYRDNHGCSWEKYKQPHDYDGVWNGSEWTWLETDRAQWYGNASIYTKGKTLIFGLSSGGGVNIPCWRDIMLGGVTVALDDPEAPTVNSVEGIPSGWVSDLSSFTITAKASDPGLGVRLITIAPQGQALIKDEVGCTGLYSSRCPASRSHAFKLTGKSFGEGERSAKLTAEDPTGEISKTYEWQTKVDRSPPEVDLEGQLAKITAETGLEENKNQSQGQDTLSLPVYNLAIHATDGSTASPETRRSGVKSIEVFLDKNSTPDKSWTEPCPNSSCEMTDTYTLKPTELAPGKHVLRVLVKDQVGNERQREIEFKYVPATGIKDEYVMQRFPLANGQGSEAEEEEPRRPELAVNVVNGNLVYRQRDVEVDSPNIDLEVERYYNSMLPEVENTEWGDGWTLAQTPQLEPEEVKEKAPATASMLGTSGTLENDIGLPTKTGEERFDSKIKAVVTKEPGGGYEVASESGETDTPIAFDEAGEATELRTAGSATVDYSYVEGHLSEIAVDDPASTTTPPDEVEEPETKVTTEPDPTYLSSFGEKGAGDGQLSHPGGVAVGPTGEIWVVDQGNNRVEHFNEKGEYLGEFGSYGSGDGQFSGPAGLAVDEAGHVWVADAGNSRIEEFDSEGNFLRKFGSYGKGNGQFSNAEGIAITPDGDVWVTDTYNSRLQKFSPEGKFIESVGSYGYGSGQFVDPTGIDIDSAGNIWVTDWTRNCVFKLNQSGKFVAQFGTRGKSNGQFEHPDALAVDPSGYVWVGDELNDRIQVFDGAGKYATKFGSQGYGLEQFSFGFPMGIAFGPGGDLWIADSKNNRLQEWFPFSYTVSGGAVEAEDDPKVAVATSSGFVTSVEGEEAGQSTYEHEKGLLTAVNGPQGETAYEYDGAGRLTKVELPNGTTGTVTYDAVGRVSSVTVDPAGAPSPKKTVFEYANEPRRTTVTPPEALVITYDIEEDGSIVEWWDSESPPTIDFVAGTLAEDKETTEPITVGDHTLEVQAHSEQGIASIDVIANGNQLVHEETCKPEESETECKTVKTTWVTYTGNWPPGLLHLEVMITDHKGHSANERFWVNIPYTPPSDPEAEVPPRFEEVLRFREEFGLDLDLKGDETPRNERIFDLIGDWYSPQTPAGEVARATAERWGVPMRPVDAAEMEYRETYLAQDIPLIEEWAEAHHPSTYAGYYVDNRAGGVLHVGFTQNQVAVVGELKQQVSLLASDQVTGYATEPPTPRTSLQASVEALEGALETNGSLASLVTEIGLDEASDTVLVGATDVGKVQGIVSSELGAQAPVSVFYEPEGEPFSGRNRTSGRILAGDRIINKSSGGCTAGFGAWEPVTQKSTGELVVAEFLLIAGHCGSPFESIWRSPFAGFGGEKEWSQIGVVKRTGAPLGGQHYETDAAAVRLEDPGLVPRAIYRNGKTPRPVGPAGTAKHGETLCFSGQKTNAVKCGEMVGVRYRKFGKTPGRHLFIITRFAGIPGDSGAPVWSPKTGRAVGMLSGGPHNGKYKDWVTPLVVPRGFSAEKVPGALKAPGMGSLQIAEKR